MWAAIVRHFMVNGYGSTQHSTPHYREVYEVCARAGRAKLPSVLGFCGPRTRVQNRVPTGSKLAFYAVEERDAMRDVRRDASSFHAFCTQGSTTPGAVLTMSR